MAEPHNTDQRYDDRVVPRSSVDCSTARCWKRGTDAGLTYYGRMSCPQCNAPDMDGSNIGEAPYESGAVGDSDNAAQEAPSAAAPQSRLIEIPFECTCDAEHKKDETGCGAKWVCIWEEQS